MLSIKLLLFNIQLLQHLKVTHFRLYVSYSIDDLGTAGVMYRNPRFLFSHIILIICSGSVTLASITSSGSLNVRKGGVELGLQALVFNTLRGCLGGVGTRTIALSICDNKGKELIYNSTFFLKRFY